MYLTRECTGLSLLKIGEIFGGRDHTTVLHGIRKVEDEMRARDATFRQVQDLTRIIRGRVRRRMTLPTGQFDDVTPTCGQHRRDLWEPPSSCGDPRGSDTLSPRVSHMSDGPATLQERAVRPGFHSAYYRRFLFLSKTVDARGGPSEVPL